MRRAAGTLRRACTTAGAAGAAAGALGAIGIGGSSALARTLSPVAQPLYIASAILIVVGALTCSRLVALLAISGGTLLYLSMFQLASGGTNGGSMSMAAMQQTHPGASTQAEPVTFYLGLTLVAGALPLSVWRRRQRRCRPIVRLPHPLPLGR